MRKVRNTKQRKDLTKILHTIKVRESGKKEKTSAACFNSSSIDCRLPNKQRIHSSEAEPLHRLPNNRYLRHKTIQQDGTYIHQQQSLELPNYKLLQVNSQSSGKYLFSSKDYYPKALDSMGKRFARQTRYHSLNSKKEKTIDEGQVGSKKCLKKCKSSLDRVLEEVKGLCEKGKFMEALDRYEKVLSEDPKNKQCLYWRGLIYFNLKNPLKCLKNFETLISIDPMHKKQAFIMSSLCCLSLKKMPEALAKLQQCEILFPSFDEVQWYKGKIYLKSKKYQKAIQCFNFCVQKGTRKVQSLTELGQVYQKMGKLEEALVYFEKVVSSQSRYPNHYLNKARCERKLGLFEKYITSLQSYLQFSKQSSAQIHFSIGYAYYKLKNYPSAIMYLEESLTMRNENTSTDSLILIAVIQIIKRDFYEALHVLKRKNYFSVDEGRINLFEAFCEGVVFLMKKKFSEGLNKLLGIQFQIQNSKLEEFQQVIAGYYSMYVAYALFCEGHLKQCRQELKKQLNYIEEDNTLEKYRKMIEFNDYLCAGLLSYQEGSYEESLASFHISTKIFPEKAEGFFYLSLTAIKLYLLHENSQWVDKIKQYMDICLLNLKQMSNNYAASIYYAKSIFSASMGDWEDALSEIDQAIERAEDNMDESFYLRALILACCQNFKQAVHEITIAISLNDQQPKYLLLRSKCLQIEGDGNKAFLDLQNYISLNPVDTEIHKYAGHLLFENGAFEDAIQAYENGETGEILSNYDVYLTRCKTYFLLGKIEEAIEDLKVCCRLKPEESYVRFDLSVIQIVKELFNAVRINESREGNLIVEKQMQILRARLYQIVEKGQKTSFGRIYRGTELKLLLAIFQFYCRQYRKSSQLLKEAIDLKSDSLVSPPQDEEYEQEQKEKLAFISQMNYNRALCYLMLGQEKIAIAKLGRCQIKKQSHTAETFDHLCNLINQTSSQEKVEMIELFSQKNKMSKHFQPTKIKLKNGTTLIVKLCIPFPKVEPPEIYPSFDTGLLQNLNLLEIERKPEAPWVIREENSIKFTENVEKYSRLEANFSEISKDSVMKKPRLPIFNQISQIAFTEKEKTTELNFIKEKLKLDEKIEGKLNKIMKKNMNDN